MGIDDTRPNDKPPSCGFGVVGSLIRSVLEMELDRDAVPNPLVCTGADDGHSAQWSRCGETLEVTKLDGGERTRWLLLLANPAEYQDVVVGLVDAELGPGREKADRPADV